VTCDVEVANRTAEEVDAAAVGQIVASVVEAELDGDAEAGVLLIGPEEMRALNLEHRGVDDVTDVLAFPIDGGDDLPDDLPRLLGDVVVCLEQAAGQAVDAGHPPGRELAILTVHGTLHLLGYDHELDEGEMLALQDRLCEGIADVRWRA
jgi:probable rRNA maturation factor